MQIFAYLDYRDYLKETIAALPGHGRGELQKISKAAGIHSSVLSQVVHGNRDLTPEQAAAVAEYFELTEPESVYFLLLTQYARAAGDRLKKLLRSQIEALRTEQTQIAKRVRSSHALTMEEKAVFYSSWFYSAARILCAIPAYSGKEALRKKLGLSPDSFRQMVIFLVEHGLCTEKEGKLSPAIQSTHLDANSPLVGRHHANWRMKAMEKHAGLDKTKELSFTSPMALSRADALRIRTLLLQTIESACDLADPSPSETAYFLNIDWLEI